MKDDLAQRKRIAILSKDTISKIAAGEVIERPASVVKELIENSLDAKTKHLDIEIEDAGKKCIQITDSGYGIHPQDLETIFNRHATSKITDIQDLEEITSLGFRGEALYSIGAISDIILSSKTKTSDSGWQVHIRGNERLSCKPTSMNTGTQIQIKELFFNTPARRKFLKSSNTEFHNILKIIIPYTLLFPQVRFKLTHHKKTLIDLPPHDSFKDRIAQTLNLNPEHIIETQELIIQKDLSVKLFLGDINIKRPRKDLQFIFVNNRPVHYYQLGFHINKAYQTLFPHQTYPFFAVFIKAPAREVDVNVHPTKREVKIKQEYILGNFLRSLCQKTLGTEGKPRQVEENHPFFKDTISFSQSGPARYKTYHIQLEGEENSFSPSPDIRQDKSSYSQDTYMDKAASSKLKTARYIGCFLKKYLLFETKDTLLIIDQHAAHERITYENLLNQITSGHIETQHLLQPIIISVLPQEMIIWEKLQAVIEKIGFSTRLWDTENIALHTHPTLIKNPELSVRNLIASEQGFEDFDNETLASKACHNALKTGYTMSLQEALTLKNRLLECRNPFSCPHGRPTIIQMQQSIFEKQFLRR